MGSGYSSNAPPSVTVSEGEASLQSVVMNGMVVGIEIIDGGVGFDVSEAPEISIAPPVSGTGATAYAAVVEKGIRRIEIVDGGSGYDKAPTVSIAGGSAKTGLSPGDIDPLYYIIGILGMALITGTYTVIGGLRAVIVTDVIQSVLMLIGGLLLAYSCSTKSAAGAQWWRLIQRKTGAWNGFISITLRIIQPSRGAA
jgi:hypothetical protein